MYTIETTIGNEHRLFTLCEKGDMKAMKIYIVHNLTGYIQGVYTKQRRAIAEVEAGRREGLRYQYTVRIINEGSSTNDT